MTQAQLVDYDTRHFFETLDALEALCQGDRKQPQDDLGLCFVCLQWACNNPDCRSGRRCALQVNLDRSEVFAEAVP